MATLSGKSENISHDASAPARQSSNSSMANHRQPIGYGDTVALAEASVSSFIFRRSLEMCRARASVE